MRHIRTINQHLQIEIGYASDMGPAGLTEAIVEALTEGGVLEEGKITYLKAQAPDQPLFVMWQWLHEPEEPPEIPELSPEEEFPEPNL